MPFLLRERKLGNIPSVPGFPELLLAIGEGIGNNAAHEIAHQLATAYRTSEKLISGMGLDDSSIDTYNGAECLGDKAPWVYTGIGTDGVPIHWGTSADQSLTNILGNTH